MESVDEFCGSTFWNLPVVWDTSILSLSDCFQKTVLVGIPCVFLWLSTPIQIVWLVRHPFRKIPWTGLNISKIIISLLIALLVLVILCRSIHFYIEKYYVAVVDVCSPLFLCVSYILVTCLMYMEKRKGMPPSGVVFIFWLLQSLVGAAIYWIDIVEALTETGTQDQLSFIVSMTIYPLIVAELVLCSLSDVTTSLQLVERKKGDDHPDLHATPLFLRAW